jgi:hypothetical protein
MAQFAIPGESVVHVGYCPDGAVLMIEDRPTCDAVAQADGTWGYCAETIRAERDRRLASCDFTQLPDAPISAAQKAKWSAYRQELRDIPLQAGFPNSVVWPIAPEE